MNCGRVSNLLSAYIDRELTGAEMPHLRSHLSDCDECRAEYEALHRTKMLLGNLRALEPGQEFLAAAMRRIEASGARMSGVKRGGADGLDRRFISYPHLMFPIRGARIGILGPGWRFAAPPGRGKLRLAVPGFLRVVPWPRITICFTTVALVAALVSMSVVLRKPRHSDALVATSPPQIIQGLDPLSSQSISEWGAGDLADQGTPPSRLLGSPAPLQWMNVSLQREGSGSFR
jgi:anti-sigma factor RsiW